MGWHRGGGGPGGGANDEVDVVVVAAVAAILAHVASVVRHRIGAAVIRRGGAQFRAQLHLMGPTGIEFRVRLRQEPG